MLVLHHIHGGKETLFDKKFPTLVKIILIFTFLFLSIQIEQNILNSIPDSTPYLTLFDLILAVFALLFLLIPVLIYFIANLFDCILFLLCSIKLFFGGLLSINNPRPIENINKLATEEIESISKEKKKWKLKDLTKTDISTLQKWSFASRDNSEKRTIPTTIFAGLIGILLMSDTIRNILDSTLRWIISNTTKLFQMSSFNFNIINFFITIILLSIFLTFLMIVVKGLLSVFKNIVAQSQIIEACIIVENIACRHEERNQEIGNNKLSLLQRLKRLFRN